MKKSPFPKSYFLIVTILLWSVVVISGYYYIHKPISPEQALELTRTAFSLFSVVAFCGLAGATGRRILDLSSIHPLERLGLQAALGFGVMSLVWLIVGLLGGYFRVVAWSLIFLGWVFLWREAMLWLQELKELTSSWRRMGFVEHILASGSAILVVIQLVFAFAPQTKWDALMYHLELPRRYLSIGGFKFISGNPYWGNPQLTELLYTWVMAFAGWEAANVLGWFFVVFFILGLYGHLTRTISNKSAWMGIIAVLVGFSFRWLMSWAYVEGLVALYGLAVWVALQNWWNTRQHYWVLLIGLFIGFSLLTKLSSGILLPISIATILIAKKWKFSRQVVIIIVISLFLFSPWLLINILYTGNPIYPYLISTPWTSVERLTYFSETTSTFNWDVFWLPLALTWFGVETGLVEGMVAYSSDIGPLLLLFAVPGVFCCWRKSNIQIAVLWIISGWVVIAIGGHFSPLLWQTRLYFSLYPAVAVAAVYGWNHMARLSSGGVRLRRLLLVLVFLVLGLNLWRDVYIFSQLNPLRVATGVQAREEYLNDALGWYYPTMQALHKLPKNSRTIFLWEPRGLYAPLDSQPDVWIDRWYLVRRTYENPEAIVASWRKEGFTHLLIYKAGEIYEREHRGELTHDDWKAFDDLIAQLPSSIEFGSDYALYSIAP